ncbi:hypothetical protein EBQ25_02965 [Allofranklinella schreckenbergeri]|uniref:Chemoreceptor zinc-binding domain-containing protein n=2 Tax=Allofranklinella schreckenbergeri TaxID=1076744 RepID=A0A3M6QEW1_9BURK|nr:hypothetical protein EBQ25_02965 [Allofranklinella schreckenbergeri]
MGQAGAVGAGFFSKFLRQAYPNELKFFYINPALAQCCFRGLHAFRVFDMKIFSRFFDAKATDRVGKSAQTDVDALLALAEMDIATAIAAHEEWKQRLLDYLENMDGKLSEDFRPDLICRDDGCDLGKWLYGPGQKRFGHYPAFSILVARHKYFHVQAAIVVAQALGGNQEEARRVLNGSYRLASNQVILMLRELKKNLRSGVAVQ